MEIENPHDKFFKETFSDVDVTKDFLNHYLPAGLVEKVNLDTLETQKDSFVTKKLAEYYSDLLFKAELGDEPSYFYFLFEHKSYPSNDIILQLYRYLGEIFTAKMDKEKQTEIPIVIPLVMYHGERKWNAPISLHEIISGETKDEPDVKKYIPNFEYLLFDFSHWSDEEVRGHAILRAYLMVVQAIYETDMERFIERLVQILLYMKELGESTRAIDYIRTMMRYVYSTQRNMKEADMEKVVNQLEKTYPEGSKIVMTLAERYIEKGKIEGKEEAQLEIASELLALGIPVKQIVKATGLSKAEVEKLK
ncbi:MAG TPA: Rpn family recombination-promoting nuclease/putative transposase [Pseudogracilibacillus sp.]|nr:Rpn family recombination-promoting nuclease/putative transposase [Pseudogracilibacillus sp.]